MGSTNQLDGFLKTFLDNIIDTFDEWQVDLPERRYITTGTPVADCESLVVALQGIKPAKGRGVPNSLIGPTTTSVVSLTVTVFRCDGADCGTVIEERGLDRARDAWVLNVGLLQRHLRKELFPDWDASIDVQWQGVDTQAPFGGMAATKLSFTVQLDPR